MIQEDYGGDESLQQFEIREFVSNRGKNHFGAWYENLDHSVRPVVQARIRRLSAGNFGQHRHLGQGLFELKLDLGPGYRIYFGNTGGQLLLLLCGGKKSGQRRDIAKAAILWREIRQGQK